MKQIKCGDTTAVTRDGREVTQLTWFDCEHGSAYSVRGVLDGHIRAWTVTGRFINNCNAKDNLNDIFAPVEYEWQYLMQRKVDSRHSQPFDTTAFHKNEEEVKKYWHENEWQIHSRIEESKREVK